MVKTYKHGYKKIDLIGKNKMFNNPNNLCKIGDACINTCMYKMIKTDTNGLTEDLIITGIHSILVDELGENSELMNYIFSFCNLDDKIDGKYKLLACKSKDFIKMEDNNIYTYYHLCLENGGNDDIKYVIWANGVLTETTSKNDFLHANLKNLS